MSDPSHLLVIGLAGSTHAVHKALARQLSEDALWQAPSGWTELPGWPLGEAKGGRSSLFMAWHDLKSSTLYVSFSSDLSTASGSKEVPEEFGGGHGDLLQLLALKEVQDISGLLHLFLCCHAVLIVHRPGKGMNVALLQRMRACQRAKHKMAVHLAQDDAELEDESGNGAVQDMRNLLERPPPLAVLVMQAMEPCLTPLHSLSSELCTHTRLLLKRSRAVAPAKDQLALCIFDADSPAVLLQELQPRLLQLQTSSLAAALAGQAGIVGCGGSAATESSYLGEGEEDGAALGLFELQHLLAECKDVQSERWPEQLKAEAAEGTHVHVQELQRVWRCTWQAMESAAVTAAARDYTLPFELPRGQKHEQEHEHESSSLAPITVLPPGGAKDRRGGYLGASSAQDTVADSSHFTLLPLLPAAQDLIMGCDLTMKFSMLKCRQALEAAKQVYSKGLDSLYPRRVHNAAIQSAITTLQSWSCGPAQDGLTHILQAECGALWGAGRQQCNALSCTGRPCILHLGHVEEGATHSSGFEFTHTTVNGTAQTRARDPFTLEEANRDPPHAPSAFSSSSVDESSGVEEAAQEDRQTSGASRLVPMLATALSSFETHSLGPSCGVTLSLLPYTYRERRGLHLPGLPSGSQLYPLHLHLPAATSVGHLEEAPPAAQPRQIVSRVGAAGGGAGRVGSAEVAALGRQQQKRQQRPGQLQDTQSFPTLAEAMMSQPQQQQQQQQRGGNRNGSNPSQAGDSSASQAASRGECGILSERSRLFRAWPGSLDFVPDTIAQAAVLALQEASPGEGREGGSTLTRRTQAPLARAPARPIRGRGGRGPGRGATPNPTNPTNPAYSAAAAADAAVVHISRAMPHAGLEEVVVHIALEYTTMDGRRFFATPQLLGLGARLGPGQAVGGNRQAMSASSSTAARFMLTHDLPLFMEPPHRGNIGAGAHVVPEQEAGNNYGALGSVRNPSMAQLSRMFVSTPPSSAPLFGCRPVLKLDVAGPLLQSKDELEELVHSARSSSGSHPTIGESEEFSRGHAAGMRDAGMAIGSLCHRNIVSRYQGGSANFAFAVTPEQVVPLPPSSLCVLTLPFAFGLPLPWVDPAGAKYLGQSGDHMLCPVVQKGEGDPFLSGCVLKGSLLFPL